MAVVAFQPLEFVGRQREVEAVVAALDGPGVVVVSGAAGMGKSRLLAEAVAARGRPVIAARAFLPERDEAWALARSLLSEAAGLDPEAATAIPSRAAAALADVVPELTGLDLSAAGPLDPESRRALALEGGVRLVGSVAAAGVPVVVDDLQWADPTSLRLLTQLIRRVGELSLALAYRPEDVSPGPAVEPFLRELSQSGAAFCSISLERLGLDALTELLGDEPVAGAVAAESDGTPLAVTEILRAMAARGVVEPGPAGAWRLAPGADDDARTVARAGQRRAIQTRAARESPRRREMLALLALVGREIPARLVSMAAEVAETQVVNELEALARSGLVRLGEGGWATAHDVIGEAVAEGLERSERGRFHHRLARALEEEGKDPAEIARHLAGSGDRTAAAAAFARAAQESLDRFAGEEAVLRADEGLRLGPVAAVRGGLLESRAEARAITGDLAGARDDLRAALRDSGDGSRRSRLLSRLAMLTGGADDYPQASELAEVAVTAAGDDLAARAEALVVSAFIGFNLGQLERGESLGDEALAIFRRLGDGIGVARVLDIRSVAALISGTLGQFAELCDQVARLYRDCGKLLLVGFKRASAGWTRAAMGQGDQGLVDCQAALELERMLAQREGVAFALWARSEVLTALGRVGEAKRDAEESLVLSREIGHRQWTAGALIALGLAHEAAGDLEQAEDALRRSTELARGMPFQLAVAAGTLASLMMARGDLAAAESAARLCLDQGVPGGSFDGRLVLAEVALARGDPGARALAQEALAFVDEHGWRWRSARPRLERRLATTPIGETAYAARRQRRTFMFTDIVGSTNLVEMLGDEAWGHLLRWHDQTLRTLFASYRGEEVKQVGDGFFVAFGRPEDGVKCAVAVQRALDRHRRDHGFAPSVRIGLHEAEATLEGGDYKGIGVHEAARIGALAGAGEITAGAAVAARAGEHAVSEPRLVTLKGISEPVQVFSIEWR